jgi:hypothetical protein
MVRDRVGGVSAPGLSDSEEAWRAWRAMLGGHIQGPALAVLCWPGKRQVGSCHGHTLLKNACLPPLSMAPAAAGRCWRTRRSWRWTRRPPTWTARPTRPSSARCARPSRAAQVGRAARCSSSRTASTPCARPAPLLGVRRAAVPSGACCNLLRAFGAGCMAPCLAIILIPCRRRRERLPCKAEKVARGCRPWQPSMTATRLPYPSPAPPRYAHTACMLKVWRCLRIFILLVRHVRTANAHMSVTNRSPLLRGAAWTVTRCWCCRRAGWWSRARPPSWRSVPAARLRGSRARPRLRRHRQVRRVFACMSCCHRDARAQTDNRAI